VTSSASARPLDAVVAGYLGVDLTPGFNASRPVVPFPELFRPGKLIETEGLHISLGGAVANTGLAMLRFGRRVALTGCVGNDTLGDLAIARLAQAGVTGGIRRKDGARTAYGFVIAPPGQDRLFLEDAGGNRTYTAADVDYDAVAHSRLFHFGYPPLMEALWMDNGAELRRLLARVRELGTVVSLDMTLPDPDSPAGRADWTAILAGALPLVDIFVPSVEELLFMLEPRRFSRLAAEAAGGDVIGLIPPESVARLAESVLAMGVKVLLIKAGSRGAYLRTGKLAALAGVASPLGLADERGCPQGEWIPPCAVEPGRFRNACGAGDCAIAGFLSAMLGGESVRTAATYAMLAGRDNLYGEDAVSGLRDWPDMVAEVTGKRG
jgi:sugar/nucleoside kinase (ribokinase family)